MHDLAFHFLPELAHSDIIELSIVNPMAIPTLSMIGASASYSGKGPAPLLHPQQHGGTVSETYSSSKTAPPPYSTDPDYEKNSTSNKSTSAHRFVVALFNFDGQSEEDLSFNQGDRIRVLEATPSREDWWKGELENHIGIFPGRFFFYRYDFKF